MKDYRLKVGVRNNRILRRIDECGFGSVRAFAAAANVQYNQLNSLVCMRSPAVTADGSWRSIVVQISDFLNVNPEDLFNDRQRDAEFVKTTVQVEINEPPFVSLEACTTEMVEAPGKEYENKQLVRLAMDCLNEREKRILNMRFGFDGPPMTCQEIGDLPEHGLSRTRVDQIEQKAMRKIQRRFANHHIREYSQ